MKTVKQGKSSLTKFQPRKATELEFWQMGLRERLQGVRIWFSKLAKRLWSKIVLMSSSMAKFLKKWILLLISKINPSSLPWSSFKWRTNHLLQPKKQWILYWGKHSQAKNHNHHLSSFYRIWLWITQHKNKKWSKGQTRKEINLSSVKIPTSLKMSK